MCLTKKTIVACSDLRNTLVRSLSAEMIFTTSAFDKLFVCSIFLRYFHNATLRLQLLYINSQTYYYITGRVYRFQ